MNGSRLLVIGASVVSLVACQSATNETPAARPTIDATLGRVEMVDWPSSYEVGGVVRAAQVAIVSSRVVAPVVEVRVAAGDRVRRGQTLVVLDAREVGANLTRAAASVAGMRLAIDATQSERRAAEASLVLAKATYDRIRVLHDKNSATGQEMDQATAGLAAAEARLAGATARAAEADAGLAAAKAAEDAASVGASYATLTAPFDGIVANRQIDPGSMAAPGVPLLTVEDTSTYRLEIRVDEARAHLVARGAAAELRLDQAAPSGDGWIRTTVAEVATVDPERHSFVAKLDLPRTAGIRSGIFGRARLLGPVQRTLAAPASSVIRRGQLALAFVIDAEGAARMRMVSPGRTWNDRVEVLAGLQDGDRVVLTPASTLEDGARVRGASVGAAGEKR